VPPILVTGGTGTLGRVVVSRLIHDGLAVRVLSRGPRGSRLATVDETRLSWVVGDLAAGTGIAAALDGVATIIHCASGQRRHSDVREARNLIDSVKAATPRAYLVFISIVGVDRVPLPYYKDKLAVEGMIERSGLPWTTLRTTQFHDLLVKFARLLARSPVMPVPARTGVQPIDVDVVADRLIELAAGPPRGRVPDMGGPEILSGAQVMRAYLRATGQRRLVVPVWAPGAIGRAYRAGGHLTPGQAVDGPTFGDFLARTVAGRQRYAAGEG
jgi:uncharacterized protein YbjT (DUF2867 family)